MRTTRLNFWRTFGSDFGVRGLASRFWPPMKLLQPSLRWRPMGYVSAWSNVSPICYNSKASYHLFLGFIHAWDCKVFLSRMDDIYELSPSPRGSLLSSIHPLSSHLSLVFAILLAPCAIVLATRFLSERVSEKLNGKQERTVWLLPYWVPVIGHAFSL